jgi:hypothetical protein
LPQKAAAAGNTSILSPTKVIERVTEEMRIDGVQMVFQAAKQALANAAKLQGRIWSQAVTACQEGSQFATMQLLPALNAMIDITTTRSVATQIHPPLVIFAMLCVLALASSLLAGYRMAGGQPSSCWIHMLAFAVIMAVTVYVILDLEYPRLGLIRVDAVDQVLVDLRDSMR